ncbi:MAG: hypothetical protein Q8P15_02980 [Nanoarchaeota archaeon]|nr:hypothetical protein [Nanoarchaeota archaeon]
MTGIQKIDNSFYYINNHQHDGTQVYATRVMETKKESSKLTSTAKPTYVMRPEVKNGNDIAKIPGLGGKVDILI